MEFHLANNPQRGELALDEKLVYDSHFWMIGKYNRYHWWPDNLPRNAQLAMGWRFVTGGETGSLIDTSTGTAPQQCAYGGGTYGGDPGTYGNIYQTTYKYTWQAPDGTKHPFDTGFFVQTSDCYPSQANPQTVTGPATDSSGYVITMSGDDQNAPTVTVSDSHGTQVYPQVVDRYGNFWSYDSAGNLVDDRGQTPVITTVSGNLIYYDVLTPKGRARYTVTTTSFPIGTSQFHQSNVEEYDNGPLPTIKSIQLPDGARTASPTNSSSGNSER